MSAEWIPWNDGDQIPEPGPYWVTCPGIGGDLFVAQELLGNYQWREWRYHNVMAYMPRTSDEPEPPVYEGDNAGA